MKNPLNSDKRMQEPMNEEELIRCCIKENRDCQRKLYEMFAPKMFALCLRYTNSREDAEDALQESFVRIFDNLDKFRFEGSFEGWLRRITVHTVLRLVQKKSPLKFAEDTETVKTADTAPDVLGKMGEQDLMSLISKLPQGYRVVFNMFAIEGYSHAEIANQLNISEGTSRSQYARARKHLQHFVNNMYHNK